MAHYHDELLEAARRLVGRQAGQRGRLPAARVRRSVSTAYYALFHFMAGECAGRLVGTAPALVRRRRLFVRILTHAAMKLTFRKLSGGVVADDVAEFLRVGGPPGAPVPVPPFAQRMARLFIQLQDQRHQADYNLESLFTALDAHEIIMEVDTAIRAWRDATTPQDRQFKEGLCLLVTLRGRLRADDA